MNNYRKNNPITREDFHSFLPWKVFWKLLWRKTFIGFCLKALFVIICFTFLSSFIPRFVGIGEKETKTKAANKSTANKRQTTQKAQTKANKK
ncbi:MAG TPA: hypothetical protein PKY82_01545 [Pyrinomonadaceae bacterium]|nr:hypothetical protein [Pyrinomonadaceae bacterium]